MNAPTSDEKIQRLEAKVDDLFFGLKIITLLFLFVASVANIVAALSIDSFEHLFKQALGGEPLPGITLMVLDYRYIILLLAFVWPVLGIVAFFIGDRIQLAVTLLALALAFALMQSGGVVYALRLPMENLMSGISNSNSGQ